MTELEKMLAGALHDPADPALAAARARAQRLLVHGRRGRAAVAGRSKGQSRWTRLPPRGGTLAMHFGLTRGRRPRDPCR